MPVSMKSRSRGIPGPEEQSNVCIDADVKDGGVIDCTVFIKMQSSNWHGRHIIPAGSAHLSQHFTYTLKSVHMFQL